MTNCQVQNILVLYYIHHTLLSCIRHNYVHHTDRGFGNETTFVYKSFLGVTCTQLQCMQSTTVTNLSIYWTYVLFHLIQRSAHLLCGSPASHSHLVLVWVENILLFVCLVPEISLAGVPSWGLWYSQKLLNSWNWRLETIGYLKTTMSLERSRVDTLNYSANTSFAIECSTKYYYVTLSGKNTRIPPCMDQLKNVMHQWHLQH